MTIASTDRNIFCFRIKLLIILNHLYSQVWEKLEDYEVIVKLEIVKIPTVVDVIHNLDKNCGQALVVIL